MTKTVTERGYKPFVVIRPQNDASRNLYTKLGFEKAYETCRVKMTPHPIKTNGAAEPTAPELDVANGDAHDPADDLEANKENQPIDEGIEDMLAEKCDIKADEGDDAAAAAAATTADEGIGDDK